MNTDDIKLPPLPPLYIVPSVEPVDYPEVAQALMDYARAAIEPYAKRIAELEAARIAYASEFAPDEDGNPDVGSIHENIRKLKAELKDSERNDSDHRKRRGEPVPGTWQAVPKHPTVEQLHAGHDAIRKAFLDDETPCAYSVWSAMLAAAPQPAEPVKGLSAEQLAEILTAYIKPEIIRDALEKLENAPWELSEPVEVDALASEMSNEEILEVWYASPGGTIEYEIIEFARALLERYRQCS